MSIAETHDFAPSLQPTKELSPDDRLALRILLAVLVYVLIWAGLVVQFGWVGLAIPALIKVPVVWTLLLIISRG